MPASATWAASAVSQGQLEVEVLDPHVQPAALSREANALALSLETFRTAVDTNPDQSPVTAAAERAFRRQAECFDEIATASIQCGAVAGASRTVGIESEVPAAELAVLRRWASVFHGVA
jgi:hypothetical protein